jgi:hypothetical protein
MTATSRFADVAERYLLWADKWTGDAEEKAWAALRLLSELSLAAIDLPDIWPDKENENEVEKQPHLPRWRALIGKFQTLPLDGYVQVFNPRQPAESEPTQCSLADDLADIYLDLERGLSFFKKGRADEAAWEWRFGFWHHWGRHLVSAQSALYQFFVDGALPDDPVIHPINP